MGSTSTTYAVVLGDCHFPFADKRALNKVYALIERLQPQYTVQIGDVLDLFAFSRYGKSANHSTPASELKSGRREAENMWLSVGQAAPKTIKKQLLGNHDARIYKKIEEKLPELAGILGLDDIFQFKDVTTAKSDKDILKLKFGATPVWFHHGFLSKPGDHVKFFGQNCVTGHSHRGHVLYDHTYSKVLYDANCGYLGNPKAHVFNYGAVTKNKWTTGCLVIDDLGPRFVNL